MASSTTSGLARGLSGGQVTSKLGQQLAQRDDEADVNAQSSAETGNGLVPTSHTSPRTRSLSDSGKLAFAQPPNSRDSNQSSSKDDISVSPSPATPQRPSGIRQSLALNLPSKVSAHSSPANRVPLSPKLDSSQIYGSPGSVLPRRSRGLDFSRACTNLHHSTLAESSPDSSPTIGGRGMNIPGRRGSHGSTTMHLSTSGQADRPNISSSVSSVNMMESDTSSSEEDDEPMMGDRDEMLDTPQVNKTSASNPFAPGKVQSPGNDWMGGYSQAASSLMSFQRARFGKNRSRHSSSSASGNSSKPSPAPVSPPLVRSIEGQGGHRPSRNAVHSRRESLSLGTRDLRLSDMSDDGEARAAQTHSPSASGSSESGPLGVVRRAVTRRGNLLVSELRTPFEIKLINLSQKQKPSRAFERRSWRRALRLTARQNANRRSFDKFAKANRPFLISRQHSANFPRSAHPGMNEVAWMPIWSPRSMIIRFRLRPASVIMQIEIQRGRNSGIPSTSDIAPLLRRRAQRGRRQYQRTTPQWT